MARYPDDVTPEEEPAGPRPMDPARWLEVLERSDSLRAVRPPNEQAARQAVRFYVGAEANAGLHPVGWVSDPRWLVSDGR